MIIKTDKTGLLSKGTLFSSLNSDELKKLTAFARQKSLRPKDILFHKGESGNQMFVIVRGRVKVSTLSEEGKEIILDILEAGNFFGEISLFDNQRRSATTTAMVPTDLMVIERHNLLSLLEKNPRMAIKMLEAFGERLRVTNEYIEDSVFLQLPSRLAKRLLILKDLHGVRTVNGVKLSIKISQQELGNLVGASRESVNKQLRAWEEEGLIRMDSGHITICKPDALA